VTDPLPGGPDALKAAPGTIADDAHVKVLVADYAGADAGGKLNIVGAGLLQMVRILTPGGPGLPPCSIVVMVNIPAKWANAVITVEVALYAVGATDPVMVPNPVTGDKTAIRMAQTLVLPAPQAPGIPIGVLPITANVLLAVGPGAPVEAGQAYEWRAKIDGHGHQSWRHVFFTQVEQTGPVVG